MMRKRWWKILLVALLILLPVAVSFVHRRLTAYPQEITIATGPLAGRYRDVSQSLAREIEQRLGAAVRVRNTRGSLDNLHLLETGEVQLALYQPGTWPIVHPDQPDHPEGIAFVANVYSEVLHLVVRNGVTIDGPWDLRGKRIGIGPENSGDYAMSLILLEHFGLTLDEIEPETLDFVATREALESGTLDAAFLTLGVQAPILRQLVAGDHCQIYAIPYADSLAASRVPLNRFTIPAGLYRVGPTAVPPAGIETVAVRAQLLARDDLSARLVEQVAAILLSEEFVKRNQLGELFAGGETFARHQPEFAVHPGAAHFYDPELRPLLNPGFVEAAEGMRSFIVSMLIAAFLGVRWLHKHQERRKEHRLDRYIRALLDLETRQIDLDEGTPANLAALQNLLDEVTRLRQKALSVFSAHELNEDRAVDCFLEMCHALSDKLNAKLSRAHLEQQVRRLENVLIEDRDVIAGGGGPVE